VESSYSEMRRLSEGLESKLAYAKEILQKSEKYERLMEDADFKAFLKDFEEGFSVHAKEIEGALSSLTMASPREQEDLFRMILIHQAKKEMLKQLVERPSEIIRLAQSKRREIPDLETQIAHLKENLNAYAG
jgi:hypothetical protein